MFALLALVLNLSVLAFLLRAFYPEHFYEDDEPVEQVLAAFNTGSPVIFSKFDARLAVSVPASISYPFVANTTAATSFRFTTSYVNI